MKKPRAAGGISIPSIGQTILIVIDAHTYINGGSSASLQRKSCPEHVGVAPRRLRRATGYGIAAHLDRALSGAAVTFLYVCLKKESSCQLTT
jgi:hypothetical protein